MANLVAVVLALVVAAPLAAAPAHRFAGRTAQAEPISFRLSADGRRIDRLAVTYLMACDAEIAIQRADTFSAPLAVRADGRFSGTLAGRLAIRGRVTGGRASGSFRITLRFGGAATCTSPAISWSARTRS